MIQKTLPGISLLHSLALASVLSATPVDFSSLQKEEAIPKISLSRSAFPLTAPLLLPKGQYVGELQEKWQFPSDHLPVRMSLDGLNLASWNVLNSIHFKWVAENSQGLSRSMLAQEHIFIGDSGLTIRDQHVVDLILEMTDSNSLISLQECGLPFLKELEQRLPPYFKIARETNTKDQNVVLYDTRIFSLVENKKVQEVYSEDPLRSIQEITLTRLDGKGNLRILNAHIPGNPAGPARYEFASYVAQLGTETPLIAMGDYNFNELQIREAFDLAGCASYQLLSPYCTNINPGTYVSKAIDHFMIAGFSTEAVDSEPDEVLKNLSDTVGLLDPAYSMK